MKFIYKYFKGGYAIPFFGWYLHLPKLAPLMIVAITSIAFGDINKNTLIEILGFALFVFGAYCFFLPVKN
jgi:hypothetical protein